MCEVGRRLWLRGLVGGGEGNISVRLSPRQFLCTPTGVSKGHLRPADLVIIDSKGQPLNDKIPSSEIRLHLKIYKHRPDCQAVVHAHPPTATGFALAQEEIPDNLLPEAAWVLGSVALVPFSMPGTEEVPDNLEPFLEDHKTFLLANHGAATMGTDLYDALYRMETLERVANTILIARMIGTPKPMPHAALDTLMTTVMHGRLS
jgi:L-fuculose-phosphate aldolase